jgi:outer membrane receptor protein involved in Fe transport
MALRFAGFVRVGKKSGATWAERFHDGWPKWRYLLDETKITVGMNNIFDTDPPRSNDNVPRFIYDPTGRFIYASVKKQF